MSVRKFEDERWRSTDQKREFRHDAAVSLIGKGAVLDVGCGDGLLLKLLKEKGIDASGVDISAEAVAKCRAAGFDAREHSVDEPLPFPDGAFDTVVLLDILEHVYDPEAVLKDAARVARGEVIVGVPNFSSLPARVQVLLGRVPENNRPNKGHLYWFNWPVLRRVVASCGLSFAEARMNTFSVFKAFGQAAPQAAPNLFALSFVIRCKK